MNGSTSGGSEPAGIAESLRRLFQTEPEVPFRGLTSAGQARRAEREVDRLEQLVKSGMATDEDRQRYAAGLDFLMIWFWLNP